MNYVQLTDSMDIGAAQKTAENINKDYPGVAMVSAAKLTGWCVYIKKTYWEYCEKYVRENCRIKGE